MIKDVAGHWSAERSDFQDQCATGRKGCPYKLELEQGSTMMYVIDDYDRLGPEYSVRVSFQRYGQGTYMYSICECSTTMCMIDLFLRVVVSSAEFGSPKGNSYVSAFRGSKFVLSLPPHPSMSICTLAREPTSAGQCSMLYYDISTHVSSVAQSL